MKYFWRRHLPWLFGAIHVSWFFLCLHAKGPPEKPTPFLDEPIVYSSANLIAGRSFHFTYENIPTKLLLLGDMPAMLLATPAILLISPLLRAANQSEFEASYHLAAVILISGTLQWMLLGAWLAQRLPSAARRSPPPKPPAHS